MTGPDAINNFGQLSAASMEALELRQQPFTDTPADGDVFADDVTEGVLTDINNALFDDYDVLLVLGEKGSGKSTLLRQLTASSQSRIACFSVKGGPRFDTAHLFGQVLDAFKTPVPTDLKDALDALMPNLQGTYERYNRLSTIVLDDADEVPVDELTKLLSSALYLNGQDEPLLRILLAAKPEFEDRLPEALPEGSEIHYATLAVEPFNTHRAKNYLEFRLNQGGYFEQFPFSDSDLQSILQQSDGNPERLNNAAAMKVNEQHGELDLAEIPPELITQNSSGHMSKMLLGGVACLMIIAGLFLFTGNEGQRSPAARVNDGYRTVETIPLSTSSSIDSTADLSADLNTQTNTISTSQSISQPSAQLELVTDAPSTLSNNLTPTAAAALTAANEPADSDFLADEGAEDENSIIVSIESDTAADSDDAINDNAFTEVPATEGSEETIADTLVAEVGEEAATADDNSDQLAAEANVETIEPASAAAAPQAAPETRTATRTAARTRAGTRTRISQQRRHCGCQQQRHTAAGNGPQHTRKRA